MHTETWELIHNIFDGAATLSCISTSASVIVRILPLPDELASELGKTTSEGWYKVLYNILRRISLNAPFKSNREDKT